MTAVATPVRVALAGNPNCGKTALFNAITGGHQQVGNYPGVTVEKKAALVETPSGFSFTLLDLPGTYSLDCQTLDEQVTRDVILGKVTGEEIPRLVIAVADACNLQRSLGLVLELKALGLPVILALNMMDLAQQRGMSLNVKVLSDELDVPVIPTVAVSKTGIPALLNETERWLRRIGQVTPRSWSPSGVDQVRERFARVDQILSLAVRKPPRVHGWTERIDRVVLHPLLGSLLLVAVLVFIFEALFSWAEVPKGWIEDGVAWVEQGALTLLPSGALRSLLIDGILAGVGSVLVFLPQILLLFFFILLLEDSGYMARTAFLMDRLMGKVGLNGRAFIPLLSSYACAVPGIMATRTIENRRDRLTTILISPLMTCSARLPVYVLLIAAFVPDRGVWGPFGLQGLVMFGLYLAGITAALVMALVFRKTAFRGPAPALLMELPTYKWPSPRTVVLGLWERGWVFIRRAGTVILALSIVLWVLVSYPKPPEAAPGPAIVYSFAGKIGQAMEPVIRPLGFDWRIGLSLIPAFGAREMIIGALATVYAVERPHLGSGTSGAGTGVLSDILGQQWSLATALSLLVWYVFACQCFSTLVVTRRETGSWKWPLVMVAYLTVLAYVGSFLTYQLVSYLAR